MFGPLKTLFDLQRRRAGEDADLVGRLDPSRTVLLEDLLADPGSGAEAGSRNVALLGAPWLIARRFTDRVASACAWLDGIKASSGKGWPNMPLYFFQAASDEEDGASHRGMLGLESGDPPGFRRYTRFFAHLPLAVQYLPIHTRVATMLEGSHGEGSLRLRALFSTFSTYGNGYVIDGDRACHPVKGRIVGYRVPDFRGVLGVSPAVATDFFARVVVHDLCHAYLPDTPNAAEGFHNVASLAAMGTLPALAYRDRWEAFIHAECTDPTFVLRAETEIAGMRKALGIPSLVQEDILEGYRKWYVHPNAVRKRGAWGLSEGASPADLMAKIEEARADGFRLYARLMPDARLMVDP